ncbi:MAG: hypothetical protein HC764_20500, partial [Pleurocapsa sp. CRU_1_2]|nr:hypothetical protein [Pleurocapsa sp. CRU_1_2]
ENRDDTEADRQTKTSKSRTTLNSEKPAIRVGDRVVVEDCPGHWSWASPFTVEAIDGVMVKLEMVGELVEASRLTLVVQTR